MTCTGCAQSVERALSAVSGVQSAVVNLAMGQAIVVAASQVEAPSLAQAIRAAGFEAGNSTSPGRTMGNEVVERDEQNLQTAARRMRLAWLFRTAGPLCVGRTTLSFSKMDGSRLKANSMICWRRARKCSACGRVISAPRFRNQHHRSLCRSSARYGNRTCSDGSKNLGWQSAGQLETTDMAQIAVPVVLVLWLETLLLHTKVVQWKRCQPG